MPGSKSPESYCCHQHRCENQVRSDSDLQSAPVAVLLVLEKNRGKQPLDNIVPRQQETRNHWNVKWSGRGEEVKRWRKPQLALYFFNPLDVQLPLSWLLISSLIFLKGEERRKSSSMLWHLWKLRIIAELLCLGGTFWVKMLYVLNSSKLYYTRYINYI